MSALRLAQAADVPALVELVGAFRDHLGATRPDAAALRDHLPVLLADPSCEFGLAFAEGRAVGYSHSRYFESLWAGGPEAFLEDLFVVADARGAGVGGALLGFAIDRARARGARAIGLHTNANNHGAQAFYRRHDFEPETEERWQGAREELWSLDLVV